MITQLLRNNLYRSLLIVAASATAFGALNACNSKSENQDQQQEETAQATPALETVPLKKGMLSTNLQVPGELIPYQEVDLYAKVSSFVKKVYVDVGSEVKQGQLLVSMEAPEINSQLAEAQSRLKSQQAIYMASKSNYDRLVETSKTPGTISGNDLEQAAARKSSDQAQFEALKSAYQSVAANRAYLDIRAPFNGVVSARNINPGAYVGPTGKGSDVPLFVIQEQKRLRLVISVPEIYTGLLKQKDEVTFDVKALPNQKFTAKVKRMAGALDERLRSERLEMDVYNNNKKLLPGMYAEVNIPLPSSDSTFVIPKTALVSSTERVFVVRVADHKAQWVDVKKGREAGDQVEIYGKLNEGDQLVKTATDEIRNGSTIKTK
ncbi:efflux RND transporter periplasmic adaptor subunit [Mucilaginibacter sp. HMF7410]|uniref:Efflux RND transporter periplasmic adaptor subunit n=1 Tax=Mucilaginibacter arboris TaxID=2682090 RepID=A0A7K1SXF9_9SPHI|nr:efflux RND transporter periplasmic adaptor subunit [Mucilaginibacter arboris]